MRRILRLAFFAALSGVVVGALLRQRDRLLALMRPKPPSDHPGRPPLAPGRYRSDVEFTGSREDPLVEIKGIGARSEERLKAAGITTFEKLADLSAEQVAQVLTNPPPGADFDSWVKQARELAEARRSTNSGD